MCQCPAILPHNYLIFAALAHKLEDLVLVENSTPNFRGETKEVGCAVINIIYNTI